MKKLPKVLILLVLFLAHTYLPKLGLADDTPAFRTVSTLNTIRSLPIVMCQTLKYDLFLNLFEDDSLYKERYRKKLILVDQLISLIIEGNEPFGVVKPFSAEVRNLINSLRLQWRTTASRLKKGSYMPTSADCEQLYEIDKKIFELYVQHFNYQYFPYEFEIAEFEICIQRSVIDSLATQANESIDSHKIKCGSLIQDILSGSPELDLLPAQSAPLKHQLEVVENLLINSLPMSLAEKSLLPDAAMYSDRLVRELDLLGILVRREYGN